MKTAIVSSTGVAEQGTLSADYWCSRTPGESWPAFQRRRQAEELIRKARVHEAQARKLRREALRVREA